MFYSGDICKPLSGVLLQWIYNAPLAQRKNLGPNFEQIPYHDIYSCKSQSYVKVYLLG